MAGTEDAVEVNGRQEDILQQKNAKDIKKEVVVSDTTVDVITPKVATSTQVANPTDNNSNDFTKKLARRKALLKRLRVISGLQLIFAILGILFMLIDNEIYVRNTWYNKTDVTSNALRATVTVTTVILLFFIYAYFWTTLEMRVVTNGLKKKREVVTVFDIIRFIFEILFCAFHPVPGISKVVIHVPNKEPIDAYVDGILCVLMIFRLYILIRFIAVNTDMYMDTSLRSLCLVNGIDFDTVFILKAYLSRFPGTILIMAVILTVGIESWAMRTCEFFYTEKTTINLKESLWIVSITFLTVGYGDTYPDSYCGRFISIITGFLGVCATALIIALLSKKLEQSKQEKLISQYATRARLDKKKKRVAAVVIRNALRVWVQKRRGNPRPTYTEKLSGGLQKSVNSMQEIRQNKMVLEQDAAETNGDTAALMELKLLIEKARTDIQKVEGTLNTLTTHLSKR